MVGSCSALTRLRYRTTMSGNDACYPDFAIRRRPYVMSNDVRLETSAAQSLMAVSAALARGAPAVVTLRHIAREVQRLTGADTVALYQLDLHARTLLPIAGYHVPKTVSDA